MKKSMKTILIAMTIYMLAGCTMPLKMSTPASLDVSGINQHSYTVGLFIPKELKEYVYIKQTSPFDKVSYPIGEQTALLFKKNLPFVFKDVKDVDSINPAQDVELVLKVSIVKFESVIPYPAYNPYTATIIYRVDAYDREEEKIFTQTAIGDAQTSKGLLSGFSAKSISVEVAQNAMENAARQIIEGLSEAEELKGYKQK